MKLLKGSEWALHSCYAMGSWHYNLDNTGGKPRNANGQYINYNFESELLEITDGDKYYLSEEVFIYSHDGAIGISVEDSYTVEDMALFIKEYSLLVNVGSHDHDIERCQKSLSELRHQRLHSLSVLRKKERN